MTIEFFIKIISGGLYAIYDYLTAHVSTCLVPAFFIAGAISALLPKEKITRYLAKNVPKYIAYPLSVIAGLLLAVCSCTILPLFAGIKKKGAGIGPAIAFLYTAPATNILAIVFTGTVIGWDFALARIVLSITFAILIGIIISKVFKGEEKTEEKQLVEELLKKEEKMDGIGKLPIHKKITNRLTHNRLLVFFATLFAILIIGASKTENQFKISVILFLIASLIWQLKLRFSKEEIKNWLRETYNFFKTIFPLILIGIFVAGILGVIFPKDALKIYLGRNTILANLIAVLFGVFMYFPTLVEVPIAKMFLNLGMSKGPLLAYLLADPVISLPSILVVRKIIGTKRALLYAILITIFCTVSGLIYGWLTK